MENEVLVLNGWLNLDRQDQIAAFSIFYVALFTNSQFAVVGKVRRDADRELFHFISGFVGDLFARSGQGLGGRQGDRKMDVHWIHASVFFKGAFDGIHYIRRAFDASISLLGLAQAVIRHDGGADHMGQPQAVADFSDRAWNHAEDAAQAADGAAKKDGLKKSVARPKTRFAEFPVQILKHLTGKALPEHVLENLFLGIAELVRPRSSTGLIRGAEAVVLPAFTGIDQHPIGFGDFLELVFSRWVAGMVVGVIFQSQFAVGFFDLRIRGVLRDSQDFVVVFIFFGAPIHTLYRISKKGLTCLIFAGI